MTTGVSHNEWMDIFSLIKTIHHDINTCYRNYFWYITHRNAVWGCDAYLQTIIYKYDFYINLYFKFFSLFLTFRYSNLSSPQLSSHVFCSFVWRTPLEQNSAGGRGVKLNGVKKYSIAFSSFTCSLRLQVPPPGSSSRFRYPA